MADFNITKYSPQEILDFIKSQTSHGRNRAGQLVKNPNDTVPEAIVGLANMLQDAARGTATGIAGIPGDISEAIRSQTSKGRNRAGQVVNPNDILGERYFPTSEELQNKLGYEQTVPLKLGQHVVASMIGPNEIVKGIQATKDMPVGLSMIGEGSKLWNKTMEKAAIKMEKGGAKAEEIRNATGLVRGLDGHWRDELSDQFAKLKENPLLQDKEWAKDKNYSSFGALHKSIKNVGDWDSFIDKAEKAKYGEKGPDLQKMTAKEFRNYKDFRSDKLDEYNILENKKVKIEDVLDHPDLFEAYPHLRNIEVVTHKAGGDTRGAYYPGKNKISIAEDLKPEEAKSTLLHEITHDIQNFEGWNHGANSKQEIKKYYDRQNEIIEQIRGINAQMSEANKAGDTEKYHQLMAIRQPLNEEYLRILEPEKLGIRDYMNNAGEAEARLVQARMNLPPEELIKHFPYEYTGAGKGKYGLDIHPDEAVIPSKYAGTINQPMQSVDYRGIHRAPGNNGYHAPAHELDRIYPDDIYSSRGHHYYGTGNNKMDRETLGILHEARGDPDYPITIYRAVPGEFAGAEINPGDWVTPSLDYAHEHGLRFDSHHILEKTVPAKHIYTNADSLHEFGYDPTE